MHGPGSGHARYFMALPVVAIVIATAVLLARSGETPRDRPAAEGGDKPAATAAARKRCARFAAPSGSDDGPGTRRRPFGSPQRLVDALRPGQTGCLRGGTYTETDDGYSMRFPRAGRAGARIRVRSYPGERAKVVGIVNVPEGSDRITLSDIDVEGDGSMNTVKVYSAGVRLERNDITNALRGQSCLILGSDSDGQAQGTVVRLNRFHDCGSPDNDNKDHAIYAANLVDGRIEDNLFVNATALTLHLYPNTQRTLVAHNVIDGGPDTVRGGVMFGGDSRFASRDNVVERNIITYTATANVYSYWDGPVGSGNILRRNCLWGAGDEEIDSADGGFTATGNLIADPRFVDRAAGDYRLRGGSPCRKLVGYDAVAKLRRSR
jgi:hypothetical protein